MFAVLEYNSILIHEMSINPGIFSLETDMRDNFILVKNREGYTIEKGMSKPSYYFSGQTLFYHLFFFIL